MIQHGVSQSHELNKNQVRFLFLPKAGAFRSISGKTMSLILVPFTNTLSTFLFEPLADVWRQEESRRDIDEEAWLKMPKYVSPVFVCAGEGIAGVRGGPETIS